MAFDVRAVRDIAVHARKDLLRMELARLGNTLMADCTRSEDVRVGFVRTVVLAKMTNEKYYLIDSTCVFFALILTLTETIGAALNKIVFMKHHDGQQ